MAKSLIRKKLRDVRHIWLPACRSIRGISHLFTNFAPAVSRSIGRGTSVMAGLGFSPRVRAMIFGASFAWMLAGALQDYRQAGGPAFISQPPTF